MQSTELAEARAGATHGNNLTALRWLAAGLVLYGHAFTLVLAALSWHFVEKPALGFKPGGRRIGGVA